jgi:hypothetical protein
MDRRCENIAGKAQGFNDYKIFDDRCEFYIHSSVLGELIVLVDKDDLDKLIKFNHKWYAILRRDKRNNYQVRTNIRINKDKQDIICLHRWLFNVTDKHVIDHINHNELDNRRCNLRVTDYYCNLKNRRGKNLTNTSGYRNVSWHKKSKKWTVKIRIDGKQVQMGKFDDVHEAGKYAELMRQKYYGDYAGNS